MKWSTAHVGPCRFDKQPGCIPYFETMKIWRDAFRGQDHGNLMGIQVMKLGDCTVVPTQCALQGCQLFPRPPFQCWCSNVFNDILQKKTPFQSISVKRSGRYHYSDIEIGGESVDMLPVAMQRWLLCICFKEVSHAIQKIFLWMGFKKLTRKVTSLLTYLQ